MTLLEESREGLPLEWSDQDCIEFHNWLSDFIVGMLEIVENDQKLAKGI